MAGVCLPPNVPGQQTVNDAANVLLVKSPFHVLRKPCMEDLAGDR